MSPFFESSILGTQSNRITHTKDYSAADFDFYFMSNQFRSDKYDSFQLKSEYDR